MGRTQDRNYMDMHLYSAGLIAALTMQRKYTVTTVMVPKQVQKAAH